jgi:hypothetical protein
MQRVRSISVNKKEEQHGGQGRVGFSEEEQSGDRGF